MTLKKTPFTELLSVQHPAVLAPMGGAVPAQKQFAYRSWREKGGA
jgi:hypothetical protein